MIFSENDASCVRTLGKDSKHKIPFLTIPHPASLARTAYTVMRLVMIIVQVNLFYAVTPDWEISLSYISLSALMWCFSLKEKYIQGF